MEKYFPLINNDGEVREISTEDFIHFRFSKHLLSSSLKKKLNMTEEQKFPNKEIN